MRSGLSLGHWLYRAITTVLALPALLVLWWRGFREPGYRRHLSERLGYISPTPSAMGGVWVHVASVGEALAALRLLNDLERDWGPNAIIWTTQTPAARALIEEKSQGKIHPFFAPLDTPSAVNRFLNRAQPRMLVLLERELWPEWLLQCEQRSIGVVIVNARLKSSSVSRWPYRSPWFRERLSRLSLVLCADEQSQPHFLASGVRPERIQITGNLKFDAASQPARALEIAESFKDRLILIAASTHEGDEAMVLDGWPAFFADHPHALLIIAPRHPQRFDTVAQQVVQHLELSAEAIARRSQNQPITRQTQVYLLDSIGELVDFYPLAHLCLMGGTWSTVGGHNALEPLSVACPVLFGPHTHQFPDLYKNMITHGAGLRTASHETWATVSQLTADPQQLERMGQAGLSFISSQQGSTGRTIAHLKGMTCWPRYPMPPVMTNGAVEDTVWFSSAQTASLEPADFAPMSYGEGVVNMATGSGRGQALLIQREGKSWVLRHYRRGGLVARFNADRYPMTSVSNSRAMQEFGLLREMVSLGLPVPPPVGARRNCPSNTWWARLVGYKADILVLCIPDTRNLAQLLDTEKPSQAVWAAIGRAIADMHSHQINHTDLNCHNILVNSSGQVWLIDFDKCKRSPGDDWKLGNVKRLLRSLNKESGRRHGFKWDPLTWQMVLDAYHGHV